MLISIIVPVFNVESYIERCIQSLISQTYKELQIILVDDESKDNSGRICDEYANKDKRITVIHQKHKGASVARNAGLYIANGDYIGFVDADDWCDPTFCEVLLNSILQNGTDVARCNYREIHVDRISPRITEPIEKSIISGREAIIDMIHNTKHSGFTGKIWNSLFRSSIIATDSERILFNKEMSYGEDWDWLARVLVRCKSVSLITECCYNYNKINILSTTYNCNFFDIVRSAQNKILFFKHHNFPKTEINHLKKYRNNKLYDGLCDEIIKYISGGKCLINKISKFSILKYILFSGRMNLGKFKIMLVLTMIIFRMPLKFVGKIWRLHI